MSIKSKLIIGLICLLVCAGLGIMISAQFNKIKHLEEELIIASNNNKAYERENSSLNGKLIEFQLTADQLNASNDSLIQRLNAVRKELKVKDKQISHLQHLASENHKKDTVFLTDTIFRKGVAIDTTLRDNWSSLKLHAEYPNFISADYSFKNSTFVIAHTSRVTVDPPKKCWIGRLFQKKQTVVEVDVVQENPYCENKEQKFIQIIDKK